jgi:L-amino acid N-acyltransferase
MSAQGRPKSAHPGARSAKDSPVSDVLLRLGRSSDAKDIAGILNHYIAHSTSTFLTEPVTPDDRRQWIDQRSPRHSLWVAEHDGRVIGWAALAEHKPRGGYRHTVEDSVYLHPDHVGRGIGRRLLAQVIDDARRFGFHVIVAGACAEQTASVRLHQSAGYQSAGHFREVGNKFDRWLDVVYFQMHLQAPP